MNSCNDGSNAPSLDEDKLNLHVSSMPLGMNASHDPIAIKERLWARRKSLEVMKLEKLTNILKHPKEAKITL